MGAESVVRLRTIALLLAVLVAHIRAAVQQQVLVACPVQRSTDIVLLQDDGELGVSETNETLSAAYRWSNVETTSSFVDCNGSSSLVETLAGAACLPSSPSVSEVQLCFNESQLHLTAFGTESILGLAAGTEIFLCQSEEYPLQLAWTVGGEETGGLLLADTGCLAAWGNNTGWLEGTEKAAKNPSGKYAEAAGFPSDSLPAAVSSFSVSDQPNPCTATSQGYSPGLTTQFVAVAAIPTQTGQSLTLGTPSFVRCDCPNHQSSGLPWAGTPSLPQAYSDGFGASFSGEFLVSANTDVPVELSAWKLVCLQSNGIAQLSVDGAPLIGASIGSADGTGIEETCRAVQLAEGWHYISLLYALGLQEPLSVLRFFLIDAVGPVGGLNETAGSDTIEWLNDGDLCGLGSGSLPCNQPYECCNFRTSYGCGADPLSPSVSLQQNPSVSLPPAPVQYDLPTNVTFGRGGSLTGRSDPMAGGGNASVPAPSAAILFPTELAPGPLLPILPLPIQPREGVGAPVQLSLPSPSPPPPGIPRCTMSAEPCWLYQTGSGLQTRTVAMSCNTNSSISVKYAAAVTTRTGEAGGWLTVAPNSGSAPASARIPFLLAIDTSALGPGEHRAALEITWEAPGWSTVVSQDLVLILAGQAATRFDSVTTGSGGTAIVSASAVLDLPTGGTTIVTNITLSSEEGAKNFTFSNNAFAGAVINVDHQINASIALPSPYLETMPSVSLNASFEVILPLGGYSSYTCGVIDTFSTAIVPTQPQCQLFAVDMAFCGKLGLVTGRPQAQLVLACTGEVTVCANCFSVSGPPQSSVQLVSYSSNSTAAAAHHLEISWPQSYAGGVTVDMEVQRALPECGLSVQAGGESETVAPVEALAFTVDSQTPVQSAAFELVDECSGPTCSFAL